MLQTHIVNLCINFDLCDFLALPLKSDNKYYIYDANLLLDESIINLSETIVNELSETNNPEWQLVFVTSPDGETKSNKYLGVISQINIIKAKLLSIASHKPKFIHIIYVHPEDSLRKNFFDLTGSFFTVNELKLLLTNIDKEWQKVTKYDNRSQTVTNKGFDGIGSDEYKTIIIECEESIIEQINQCVTANFDEAKHLIVDNIYEIKSEQITELISAYKDVLESVLDRPDNFDSFTPSIHFTNLLRDSLSIYSEKYSQFNLLFYKHISVKKDWEAKLDLQFLLLLLTENGGFLKQEKPRFIGLELSVEDIIDACVTMRNSLELAQESTKNKLQDKTVEIELYSDNVTVPTDFDNLSHVNHSLGRLDFIFKLHNFELWEKYIDNQLTELADYSNKIETQISTHFLKIARYQADRQKQEIPDVFELNNQYQNQEIVDIEIPEEREILAEFNNLCKHKTIEANTLFKYKPRVKFICISIILGFLSFLFGILLQSSSYFFISLPIILLFLFILSYFALVRINKKIKKIEIEIDAEIKSCINKLISKRNTYSNYYRKILIRSLHFKNTKIIKECIDNKNNLFLHIKLHKKLLISLSEKIDKFIVKVDNNHVTKTDRVKEVEIDYFSPEYKNKLYHINTYIKHNSPKIIGIGPKNMDSIFNGLIKKLTLEEIESPLKRNK